MIPSLSRIFWVNDASHDLRASLCGAGISGGSPVSGVYLLPSPLRGLRRDAPTFLSLPIVQ